MNNLEKALALLDSKSFRLKDIHKETGISLSTLKAYSSKRIDLKNVAWKTVNKLALCYDRFNSSR